MAIMHYTPHVDLAFNSIEVRTNVMRRDQSPLDLT